jgi:hypothetical protein
LLIGDIAEQVARRELKPSLAKKLHVLAAYEVERHRKRAMDLATQATLQGGTDGQGNAGIAQVRMISAGAEDGFQIHWR